MLDDFRFDQPIVYKTLINSLKNDKISHAYLIEAKGYSKALAFSIAFAKSLLCKNGYTNDKKCYNCTQCNNIDNSEFLELKIINADGQWIKKSQLDELQFDFSKKSIIGKRKVYIINGAEKLNQVSANSLLKFLEEPEDGIVAILIVDNIYHLIDTIVSRCQILPLRNKKDYENLSTKEKIINELETTDDLEHFFDDESSNLENIISFIKHYEENHEQTIIYVYKLWHKHFNERNDIHIAFKVLSLFYQDVLNFLVLKKIKIFQDFEEDIIFVSEKNSVEQLISKINIIITLSEKIKYNSNANLLLDKLIIELGRCEKND